MTDKSRSMVVAMFCAAAVTAQFIGGKATRDALFLTSLPITAIPAMLIATSACSLLLVGAQSRWGHRTAPGLLIPAAFAVSGVLFVAEWLLRSAAPSAVAIGVYLHVSGAGPLLASGFWLIASERFDPRAAKKGFGRLAGAGTLGGLLGALLSERVAAYLGVPATLLLLAALQFVAAGLVWWLARTAASRAVRTVWPAAAPNRTPAAHGLRLVAETAPLRHLAALVLLGTTGAALLEYLFKAKAVETLGPGDHLLRFFALYYAGTGLVTFFLQAFSSRAMLERFGLALTTSTPSIALLAGSLGSLVAPGFGGLMVARAGETIFRGSWFRAGYELFYTPMRPDERRAAKSVIDVGFDRLGDAVGGGIVRLAIVFIPLAQSQVILVAAAATAVGAIIVASTLNRWYLRTLEHSLLERASGLDAGQTERDSIRTALMDPRTGLVATRKVDTSATTREIVRAETAIKAVSVDPELQDILALRSRQRERIVRVLSRDSGLTPGLVPFAVPLLGWDAVAGHVLLGLRKVVDEHVGLLTDTLLDPQQDLVVRRRLTRVLSASTSERAADALIRALDSDRFDIRFQAARSLAAMVENNPGIVIASDRITVAVLREVEIERPVWESQRLLEGVPSESAGDDFLRNRAGQSLAHVFTMLSLILPREPLQIAFRSLRGDDVHLRGTALEYLEGVLPAAVRQALWPFLVRRRIAPSSMPRREAIANLIGSAQSITLQNMVNGGV